MKGAGGEDADGVVHPEEHTHDKDGGIYMHDAGAGCELVKDGTF